MSRRSRKGKKKQSFNPIPIIIGIAAALLVVIAAVLLMNRNGSSSNITALDHNSYNKASKQHQGSKVKVTGSITTRQPLGDSHTLLQIDPDGESDGDKPVGVIVSDTVRDQHTQFNLDLNNSYIFVCKVDKQGFLRAEEIESK